MRRILNIVALLALVMLSSCRCKQQFVYTEPVVIHERDSVTTKYIKEVRVDTVTVEVKVPYETERQIVRDSVSHVETSLAESTAWINPDGSLGHSITNKEQTLPAEAYVPTEKETVEVERIVEVEVPVLTPVQVEVERSFTKWERFKMGLGLIALCVLAGVVAISVGWYITKKRA